MCEVIILVMRRAIRHRGYEEITVNENDVISAFADLCGCLGLDPVDVLKVLNAQDWSQVEDISTARLKVHED
jgi:hypothetical protein